MTDEQQNPARPDELDQIFDELRERVPGPPRPTRWRLPLGWGTVLRRGRVLWIGAASGALLLIAGLLVGHYALPTAATTSATRAGLVTVPVRYTVLKNVVTMRGQVGYANSLDVTVDSSSESGPAVVTGHVPSVGTQLKPLSIALEVAGRPVIVLPGALAAYRTLSYGMSGPDVVQFKKAMRAVGLDAGDPGNALFDQSAAESLTALYSKVGYTPPAADEGIAQAVTDAQAAEQSAQDGLAASQNDLSKAAAGPTAADVQEADNTVRSAQRALATAKAQTPEDANAIGDLRDALDLASTQRHALDAVPDTSAEQLAVRSATAALSQAKAAITLAQQKALPTLPLSEVLYVGQLPARVDKVNAKQGVVLDGSAMTLSGTSVGLSGTVDPGDAKLMKSGDTASFDMPDGGTHAAKVTTITPGASTDDRTTIALTSDTLTAAQIQQLAGQNVKVSVPVGATKGAVLAVPEAALSAGPGGKTRVEVVDGDPRDGSSAATHLVVVKTGLAANGDVEVHPTSGSLHKNDLVVVAR